MAGRNRHIKGDINPIIAPVHSYHIVEAGDFMVLNSTSYYADKGITADNYAVPFNEINGDTTNGGPQQNHWVYTKFLGVAMEDSPAGVTENITIATTGVFRYPMHSMISPSAVTIGSKISAVSPTLTGGNGVSQQIVIHGTTGIRVSTAYLGYIVKTESGASFVDFAMYSAFGPGGLVSQ